MVLKTTFSITQGGPVLPDQQCLITPWLKEFARQDEKGQTEDEGEKP